MPDRIKDTPRYKVEVAVEPNHNGQFICWRVQGSDGTQANGLAKSAADAMHDCADFVEAMMQPRIGGFLKKPELREVK